MNTWIEVPNNTDFSIYNLPFGIFSKKGISKRVGVAIGNKVIDLLACNKLNIFADLDIHNSVFENTFLNDFINLGKKKTNKVREILQKQLIDENSKLKMHNDLTFSMFELEMHMDSYFEYELRQRTILSSIFL